ncbi:MAG: 16S rRNA (guanine(527)-N(7))-methyltransferase RsmG [Pseudomonadota bacterium]
MNREEFIEYFDVSRETVERLDIYAETLLQWQPKINLISPRTVDELWGRHFADSAQLFSLLPNQPSHTADLGSGAGFPGLVLAIMRAETYADRGEEKVRLVESDQRKAAFLREVSRKVDVAVDIDVSRIEYHANHSSFKTVNTVTARALAPMHKLLGYAVPFFSPATTGLFLKGREVEAEIKDAEDHFAFAYRMVPSVTDPEGRIVVVTNLVPRAR